MTDKEKLEKVRAEIERLYHQSLVDENRQAEWGLSSAACTSYGKSKVCKELLSFTDSMQKEPKECMYSKDNYTDEDRKALCEGCEEECEYKPITEEKKFEVSDTCLIQYVSREAGIKAHAEDYSFNIESELFQQLTPEQQKLWRKEIEQAVVSGGHCGLELAKDKRYDEEPVSDDLEQAIDTYLATYFGGEKEKQDWPFLKKMAIYFANWQKQQLMAKAVDTAVHIDAGGYSYIPHMELTMSKAEKFIEDCTRRCSNELIAMESRAGKEVISYHEWLTPDQARKAVEIAREEIYELLQKRLPSYIVYCNNEGVLKGTELYVNDLKQAMKDVELTWEDIEEIGDLLDELLPSRFDDVLELKGAYEEVSKRFNAQKDNSMTVEEQLDIQAKAKEYAEWLTEQLPDFIKSNLVRDALYCAYLEGADIRTK